LGEGFRAVINDSFSELGIGNLILQQNNFSESKFVLNSGDIDLLKNHPNISYVTGFITGYSSVSIQKSNENKVIRIVAGTEDSKFTTHYNLLEGRFINYNDIANESNSIVIDSNLSNLMFGGTKVIGKNIGFSVGNVHRTFVIVGVIEGARYNETLQIPPNVYTGAHIFAKSNSLLTYDYLEVKVEDVKQIDETSDDILRIIDISRNTKDGYSIYNPITEVELVDDVIGNVSKFVIFVAFISLIVGGIGIMNIMLISVNERTREIGIRKSLGAKYKDICLQFLFETIIVISLGSIVGLALGVLLSDFIGIMMDIETHISILYAAIALLISILIGVIFGVYPATVAAKLDPIKALTSN